MDKMNLKYVLVLAEPDLNGNILGKRAKENYNAFVNLEKDLKDIKVDRLIELILCATQSN